MIRPDAREEPTGLVILGAGQLGYFLCRSAKAMGLHATVVGPDPDSPATAIADRVINCSLNDVATTVELADQADMLTFEVESVGSEVLDALATLPKPGIVTQARVLRLLQDKLQQKRWLVANRFPTAPFVPFDGTYVPSAQFIRDNGYPFVQKRRKGGYDGQGVQVVYSESDTHQLWQTPSLLEAFVPQARELTVLVARNQDGDVRAYAPASTHFNDAGQILDQVCVPARCPESTCVKAVTLAEALVNRLQGVGLYAVEFFLTSSGALLVNEISARVHNAGHHTLESCETSQFEQHLRACLNLPLGEVTLHKPHAVMQNLLGGEHPVDQFVGQPPFAARYGDAVLHWYGKRQCRPLRKMGHITALGDSEAGAQHAIATVLRDLARSTCDNAA